MKILRSANVVLGALLALSPFVLFPVCSALRPDGTHMACWYSGLLITAMGAVIVLLSLMKKAPAVRAVMSCGCALACWFVPNRIIALSPFGLCADPEHACRASMMPAVGVLVIMIAAVCVAGLAADFVRGGR